MIYQSRPSISRDWGWPIRKLYGVPHSWMILVDGDSKGTPPNHEKHLSLFTKERLDRFGPYGSGIGTLFGAIFYPLLFHLFPLPDSILYLEPFLIPIFAYLFCTCIHRKYYFFSTAALAGALGALLAEIVTTAWVWSLILTRSIILVYGGSVIILFMIPFSFSHYVCNRQQRKEQERIYQSYYQIYGQPPPQRYPPLSVNKMEKK